MKWIEGPQYDYPEGFPRYEMYRTLWHDLDVERTHGEHDKIPKEFRRRRWVPGVSFFSTGEKGEGQTLEVDWMEVSPIPMRTIKWILATDTWQLNHLKRDFPRSTF